MSEKVRFCPSPSGLIHLGNARTALFNSLYAISKNAVLLLRIEDTDQTRSKSEYTEAVQRDLKWLGVSWQEGVDMDSTLGKNGPYFQSQRQEIYDNYYKRLEDSGHAYPCFCSEDDLKLARKLQQARGQAPRYAGTCRNLSEEERQEKIANGLMPTLRFHMPDDMNVGFNDGVKARQEFLGKDIGDFIIRRADGTASFMFCNAVDDALMQVTHVFRGEDHLTNTPRQLAILERLGLPKPDYFHISLILGHDGAPLSKRHGSRSLHELSQIGFLPLALVNYLARLGHHYESDDLMDIKMLGKKFSVDNLSGSSARYDEVQLMHWQKLAVQSLSDEAYLEWASRVNLSLVPSELTHDFLRLVRPNVRLPSDITQWAELLFSNPPYVDNSAQKVLDDVDAAVIKGILEACNTTDSDFDKMKPLLIEQGIKGKLLFQTTRSLISGSLAGPELSQIMSLLGKVRCSDRIEYWLKQKKS